MSEMRRFLGLGALAEGSFCRAFRDIMWDEICRGETWGICRMLHTQTAVRQLTLR